MPVCNSMLASCTGIAWQAAQCLSSLATDSHGEHKMITISNRDAPSTQTANHKRE